MVKQSPPPHLRPDNSEMSGESPMKDFVSTVGSILDTINSIGFIFGAYMRMRFSTMVYLFNFLKVEHMPSKMHSSPIISKKLDKRFTLIESERRFRKACDQIVLLNQKLGAIQKRYKSARNENNRAFRYNYRLRLAVIEGMRNMYYDYAYAKADQVAELRRELFNETVEIVSQSDSDYTSDSE